MKRAALSFLMLAALASCTTVREVTTEKHITDTVYMERNRTDSIHITDTVMVEKVFKGDTITIDRVKVRTVYRDRWQRDTIRVAFRDSTEVERVEQKPTPAYSTLRIFLNGVMVLCLVIGFVVLVRQMILLKNDNNNG